MDINVLAEQTKFLLDKQQETVDFFKEQFKYLYTLLETERQKAELAKNVEQLESFQNVKGLLGVYEERSVEQLAEDVAFLKEQLAAVTQIQNMEDPERAKELTDMLLESDQKLAETKQFKADVEQEAAEVKESFAGMIEDIEAVLLDEGVKELERLLEAHAQDAERECGSSCNSCEGCNIFEGLEEEPAE